MTAILFRISSIIATPNDVRGLIKKLFSQGQSLEKDQDVVDHLLPSVNPPKRRMRGRLRIAFLLLPGFALLLYIWVNRLKPRSSNDPSKQIESQYLHSYTKFLANHPSDEGDGKAFAMMGLQADIYSSLLKDPRISQDEKEVFEKRMWFFVPAISDMRKRALSHTQNRPHRGIIMSASASQFVFACHFLATLRNVHKSTLPVEVFYHGEEDLPGKFREYLSSTYSVRTIDLDKLGLFDESFVKLKESGWAIKPFALLAASFNEVLMVDADTILLEEPNRFFEQAGYRNHGTVFFRDRLGFKQSDASHAFLQRQFGSEGPSRELKESEFWKSHHKHRQESGVVVMDKSRPEVFAALLLAAWQNSGTIRTRYTYKLFYGDKESFWLSFELGRFPYYMVHQYSGDIGPRISPHAPELGFCGDHPLHFFDFEGEARDHTVRGKPAWFNGSLRKSKLHGKMDLLDVNDTIWGVDGTWSFHRRENTWCMRNFTQKEISRGFGFLLEDLVRAGSDAGKSAEMVQSVQS